MPFAIHTVTKTTALWASKTQKSLRKKQNKQPHSRKNKKKANTNHVEMERLCWSCRGKGMTSTWENVPHMKAYKF